MIGFCIPANEKIGPGDRYINEQLDAFPRAKKVAIVTKIDASSRPEVAEQLLAVERAARLGRGHPALGARQRSSSTC